MDLPLPSKDLPPEVERRKEIVSEYCGQFVDGAATGDLGERAEDDGAAVEGVEGTEVEEGEGVIEGAGEVFDEMVIRSVTIC